jgi:hypothetical protein
MTPDRIFIYLFIYFQKFIMLLPSADIGRCLEAWWEPVARAG